VTTREAGDTFACFGGRASVHVIGDPAGARAAVARARRRLLAWHARFTRFEPDSELMRLNADPRTGVLVTPLMARFAEAARAAAERTGGLVDATLLGELEQAGYRGELSSELPLGRALGLAPPRTPARASRAESWRSLEVEGNVVRRPPGLVLDSGGLAKGLFADVLAESLSNHAGFAVECAGDLRVGGRTRQVRVESPFDGRILRTFELADVAVATSGIGRRSWLDERGRPAHHLLDPSTGRPAYTGVVQATAMAPTAVEAEWRAKAAVLSGPDGALDWLPHGGVVALDDGSTDVSECGTSWSSRACGPARGCPPCRGPARGSRSARAEAGRGS
jgi:FAD:protein FMN transferase